MIEDDFGDHADLTLYPFSARSRASDKGRRYGTVSLGVLRLDGNYDPSPIEIRSCIYFCSREGKTTVLAPDRLDDSLKASPAIVAAALPLRRDARLFLIEKLSGQQPRFGAEWGTQVLLSQKADQAALINPYQPTGRGTGRVSQSQDHHPFPGCHSVGCDWSPICQTPRLECPIASTLPEGILSGHSYWDCRGNRE